MLLLALCRVTKMDYEPINIAGLKYKQQKRNWFNCMRVKLIDWQIQRCYKRTAQLIEKAKKLED